MKKLYSIRSCALYLKLVVCVCVSLHAGAQQGNTPAGSEYKKSAFHQWLWGRHYRAEWITPVQAPPLNDGDSSEYVLRTVQRKTGIDVPEIYRNTFIEKLAKDQASGAHPYSALTIAPMAAAAGIPHTQPVLRAAPGGLYIMEPRANAEAESISTEELLGKLLESNKVAVDKEMYVRARLFDMLVGNWNANEKKWRWRGVTSDDKTVYQPMQLHLNQAYSKFDGVLLRIGLAAAGLSHTESFSGDIDDINTFNFPARNLDRRMANEVTLQQWLDAARGLQQALTDEVITTSVNQLPPEVFPLSGEKIIAALKSRRDKLEGFATKYYQFLAKEIDVPATREKEHFEIVRQDASQLKLSVYRMQADGTREPVPYYERVFNEDETKEIRVYDLAGNDTHTITGESKNDIRLRIVNDPQKYRYDAFNYDKKGLRPAVFFSNNDRFYAGLGYKITKQGWNKDPFAYEHGVYARYSINQKAFSFGYEGIITELVGKWDLLLNADYDAIRWTNFFGVGNESIELKERDIDYYRIRSRELYAGIGLGRRLGQSSNLRVTPFFQATKIIKDEDRFISDNTRIASVGSDGLTATENWDKYAGLALNYSLLHVDDAIVPSRGMSFTTTLAHTRSLESERTLNSVGGTLNFYLPITRRLVLAVRNGGSTVTGEPKFYQLSMLGGSMNLRGYRRDRFRGRSAFYNSNEVQWHFDFKSKIFNGKAGPIAFYDIGRVWQPGEESNKWHAGYGAGIMMSPFNKAMIVLSYGMSKERGVVHVALRKPF